MEPNPVFALCSAGSRDDWGIISVGWSGGDKPTVREGQGRPEAAVADYVCLSPATAGNMSAFPFIIEYLEERLAYRGAQ